MKGIWKFLQSSLSTHEYTGLSGSYRSLKSFPPAICDISKARTYIDCKRDFIRNFNFQLATNKQQRSRIRRARRSVFLSKMEETMCEQQVNQQPWKWSDN